MATPCECRLSCPPSVVRPPSSENDHEREGARSSGVADRRGRLGDGARTLRQTTRHIVCHSAGDTPYDSQIGHIRIGIGGWTFEPWRGAVLSEGPAAREGARLRRRAADLDRGQRHVLPLADAGDVPQMGERGAATVSCSRSRVSRFAVNRRVLEGGRRVRSSASSVPASPSLATQLGPLLWQFAPTKKFDAADFGGFLELLPDKFDGRALRHVIEVRHDSFGTPKFIALLRKHKMPVVFTDHAKYPNIADLTGDFVYARLQRGKDTIADRLSAEGHRRLGRASAIVGARRGAGRSAACRSGEESRRPCRATSTPRRFCLRHPRRQGPRAGGGDGVDRAVGKGRVTTAHSQSRSI